jgi:hypothetical protein
LLDELKIAHNSAVDSVHPDVNSKEKTKIFASVNKNEHPVETNEMHIGKFSPSTFEVRGRMPRQRPEKNLEHLMKDLKVASNVSNAKHPRVVLKQVQPRSIEKGNLIFPLE